jgi:FkbM family methyltransferase
VKIKEVYGISRSLAMYYGIPLRRRRMSEFYSQFIAPNSLCFDIGAHVGNRVRVWVGLGASVIAVEPQPKLVSILRSLYGRNKHVTILPVGVSDQPGLKKLHISSATPTMATFSEPWMDQIRNYDLFSSVKWDHTIEVVMTTLDQMIERYGLPDFCKIDVEGYEFEVLEGLSQPIGALSFEYIPAAVESSIQCIDRLEKIGPYKFNWSRVETMQFSSPRWLPGSEMKQILKKMPRDGRSGDIYAKIPYADRRKG